MLGVGRSKRRSSELGIGSRVTKYRRHVLNTIEAKKEVRLKARTAVVDDLRKRIDKIEKKIRSEKTKLENKAKL